MIKRFIIILVFGTTISVPMAQSLKKVLFLGNSYTFVNDLPGLIAQIAHSKGDSLFHDQNTPGGCTFESHSQDPVSRSKINSQSWDYVVLQEQSQRPALWPDTVIQYVFQYADTLNRLIKTHDSCSHTLFFMTWGRKNSDPEYCPVYPPVCSYEGMQARLRESYLTMAEMLKAEVSPVGIAWRETRIKYPMIGLYAGDESHPSLNGSYLAACTFYAAVFHKSPVGAIIPTNILQEDGDNLQRVAAQIVFDSIPTWLIDTTRVYASFHSNLISPLCFRFQNTSLNAKQHSWNFGDGTSSDESSPDHCFPNPGNYEVSLIAANDCQTDSAAENLVITSIEKQKPENIFLSIFPVPSSGKINFTTDEGELSEPMDYTLYSQGGTKISTGKVHRNTGIDLSCLPDGVYSIILDHRKTRFFRLIIIRK